MSSSFFFLSFLFILTLSSAAKPPPSLTTTAATSVIQQACKATNFSQQCESTLSQSNLPPNPTSLQLIQAAMAASSSNLTTALTMAKSLLDASTDNKNRTVAAAICLEVLNNSKYRISLANSSLPSGKTKDARAWLSAALAYTYDCSNVLKYVNDTKQVAETISFVDSIYTLNSNTLSLAFNYDAFGDDIGSWTLPKTERDGFWDKPCSNSGSGAVTGLPDKSEADVTVCKGGKSGCLGTIQEAVNKAPDNGGKRKKFVIYIKEGVYKETVKVPLEKRNVVFLGDGIGKTVITGSANAGQVGVSTYTSATVAVVGDGFVAKDLTIQNTAASHQAVAFKSDSDLSIIQNCEFLGNQDTLLPQSLRQFYKSCYIQGNIDFIFGNSATIFQDCEILTRPRQENPEKGASNTITAHGRTDPAQATGFVFQNCLINGTKEYLALYHSNPKVHKNFLGRPWKLYSRTVFINSRMDEIVTPQGWSPWTEAPLKTLYYGEFENSGPGSDLSQRVPWSSKIPSKHVLVYSVENFIQGKSWIPPSLLSSKVGKSN
ncbi:hypothetical protein TanjilG_31290 [Lupinus angustifolius]|uniref:pectinesterase n=1 Tax=Lupinus angustifolius TaxID=3871 RepID=A0A4P1RTG5_LUPAN|nr:PREDICTED: probable pectinesterase/pectinesterase inhibitor 51 [Lupinus angustifolius]OIW18170.1 hypothetical protein TanjilG_31290 [Lupinus angustifolius]